MSQQLTISSLASALALVSLALFARVGDMVDGSAHGQSLVQIEAPQDLTV